MFERIAYQDLNARQQENYNFHKIAAILADYGYTSMRLSDDWMGADFIAYHRDGKTMLRVQLKGRMSINKKYLGKDIHIAFLDRGDCYVYPHDEVCAQILDVAGVAETQSWQVNGSYGWPRLPAWAGTMLRPYQVGGLAVDRAQKGVLSI